MLHRPHPLLQVERCSRHEQVDGVTDGTFEIIPGHAVVVLEVADDGLDGSSASEALSGFEALVSGILLLWTTWNHDPCVTDLLQPPVASVADRH